MNFFSIHSSEIGSGATISRVPAPERKLLLTAQPRWASGYYSNVGLMTFHGIGLRQKV